MVPLSSLYTYHSKCRDDKKRLTMMPQRFIKSLPEATARSQGPHSPHRPALPTQNEIFKVGIFWFTLKYVKTDFIVRVF